jgi:hypothetical protein
MASVSPVLSAVSKSTPSTSENWLNILDCGQSEKSMNFDLIKLIEVTR